MSAFLKVLGAAAALSATASSMARAYPIDDAGLVAACQSGNYTPHGIWDCH